MAVQFLRARLAGRPLPEVQLDAPAQPDATDSAHAGAERIEPDPEQAAQLLDRARDSAKTAVAPHPWAAQQELWLVECGNFTAKDLAFPGLRARTHLEALQLMGAVAAVPGSMELQLTPEQAGEFLKDSPVPIVSCNIQLKLEGVSIAPYIKLAPGWYLTGVSSWQPAAGEPPQERWWELTDPVQSVNAVRDKLPGSAQLIVIATHQPAEVFAVLCAMPVAAVVGQAEDKDHPALVPSIPPPSPKAEQLRLATFVDTGRMEPVCWSFDLADVWPGDKQVVALFKEEYQRVRERILGVRANTVSKNGWRKVEWGQSDKYLPSKDGASQQADAGGAGKAGEAPVAPLYAGAAACRTCHADAYAAWEKTRHFKALASLSGEEERGNLDCLACHSTGLLAAGGYDPFAPDARLGMVGCESCHGPGAKHVALMGAGAPGTTTADSGTGLSALEIQRGNLEQCLTCHDPYNSPHFEAQSYWEKVKH